MIFGTVSLVLGGIFWLLTGVFSQGNSQTAGSLARGWTSLIIVSSIGCGLALKQGWGDHRMLATILVFSFIFIGGAVLNQWVWRRRLLREQAQEEPGTGYTRALR